jgi:hypothetical protein
MDGRNGRKKWTEEMNEKNERKGKTGRNE